MRTNIRRATIVLATAPVMCLPVTAAFAGSGGTTTITTPAPDGDASAVAAEISGILTIGKTHAHAGQSGGSASADALSVLGNQLSGGEQNGAGSKDGNLVGTGATPVGDVEAAPWSAKVTGDGTSTQSQAEAALATADVAGAAKVWLLHSKSSASWTQSASTSDSESDVAEVDLLDALDVKVLHSEAHSTGKSQSALLVVNGQGIVTSDDVDGMCAIDADPLLNLLCLTATGGPGAGGTTTSGADGALADVGGGALTGTVTGVSSGAGSAAPAGQPTARNHHTRHHSTEAGPLPHTNGPAPQAALPFTGSDTGRMGAIAAALAALGAAMTAHGRRRRALRA